MAFHFESGRLVPMVIPQLIADSYLSIATGAQIKVFLCLSRFEGMPLTEEMIAAHCALSTDEVKAAIKFWVDQKLLCRRGSTLTLQSHAPELLQSVKLPTYTPAEILERKETDSDFATLLEEVERLLGKVFNHNDISILYGIYDNLGFGSDLTLQLIGFCAGAGKTGFRYIERVALDWHDRGIDTFDKAEAYIRHLEMLRSSEFQIAKMFGLGERALSKKEKEYIEAWVDEMQFSMDMIEAAYEACVDTKGKMSFSYINGILKDWHQKGYKKPEDIQKAPQKAAPDKKGYDLSAFERAAIAKLHEE